MDQKLTSTFNESPQIFLCECSSAEHQIIYQYDFDGKSKEYGPISITYTQPSKKVIKYVNTLGQEVDFIYKGMVIEVYDDLTTRKVIRW
jgi:hypothetical protein